MAFNGSGTFSLVAGNPVVTGTTISSTWANNTLTDIATNGLTNVICKDGQTTITANIPMAGFKFTGLGAGTTSGNSLRYEQLFTASGITLIGDLLFTDAQFDIGKSGATRPRDGFFSRNLVVGGHPTLEGVTAAGATGNTNIVFSASPTLTGSPLAPTQSAGDNSTKIASTAYVDRGASGASIVLISTSTASNSASIDFTSGITATYDEYLITMTHLLPQTDNTDLWLRFSEDGGGSFKAGGTDYAHVKITDPDAGGVTGSGSTADAKIVVCGGISNTTISGGLCGEIRIFAPSGTASKKLVTFQWAEAQSGGTLNMGNGSGKFVLDQNAINGFRLIMSSGQIVSGNFALYGLRKA